MRDDHRFDYRRVFFKALLDLAGLYSIAPNLDLVV
jgi:hypothetical protein